ncbi:MAG: DNA polymerase I, partial [archaeon]|nr:DNA polymerase I [archaeon]
MAEKKKTLIILDSNALVHRAFHALPPFTSNKGELVNAVFGFMLVFFKVVKEFKPDYVVATFDMAGPTVRHKEFAEYKATRKAAPDELYAQIPMIKRLLEALHVPVVEKQGYEADDLIGMIAKKATAKKNINTVIV